jgi:hypothetical protein
MDYASLYVTDEEKIATDEKESDYVAAAYSELPHLWSGFTAEELAAMREEEDKEGKGKKEQEVSAAPKDIMFFPPPTEQSRKDMEPALMVDMFYSTGTRTKYFDLNLP